MKRLQYLGTGKSAVTVILTDKLGKGSDSVLYSFSDVFLTDVGQSEAPVGTNPRMMINGSFTHRTVAIQTSTNGTVTCAKYNVATGVFSDEC